ncbi:Adhesion G protein-coupled receptor E1 [Orchesella cincta]|uniref:Adhesion G protein-coupled receptor E1 n=1 Tax=Orchesella cincta TaxID=48709 RepID=A0A1D2N466_ORCCI|nr:Adhesion G protein-coupled receptor E1 [Orchesella cincta]
MDRSIVEGGAVDVKSLSVPPKIEVYEIRRENADSVSEKIKSFPLVNVTRNSDLLYGEETERDSGLLLKCSAPYSVQWVFRGDSNPEFNTNTTTAETRDGMWYNAFLHLGSRRQLTERETGKYICTSVRNKRMQSYIYVFVTRAALFTNRGLETIHYTDKDESIRIPCSLSEPRAIATLQKSQDGVLKCPMNDSVRFDSKQGFFVNPKKLQQPQGTYLCIADYNNTFQIIKYNVEREDGSNTTNSDEFEANEPEFEPTQNPPSSQQSTPRPISDSSSPGAGDNSSSCANVTCGENASCIRNTKQVAVCRCKDGYIGNPYVECKDKSLTTTTTEGFPSPPTTTPSNSYPNDRCNSHKDCPNDRACIHNTCQDPCTIQSICGPDSYCNETTHHIPVCKCKEGYTGDPYSSQEGQKCESSHCKPNPCGENTICNYVRGIISCSCKPGFATHDDGVCHPKDNNKEFPDNISHFPPPTSNPVSSSSPAIISSPSHSHNGRKECYYDTDCPDSKMCIQDRCEDPCINACGSGAVCHVRNHFPRCNCPEGATGDPFYKCNPLFSEILSSSASGSKETHEMNCGGRFSPCGPNTVCQATSSYFVCACPNNFVGDPYSVRGCYRENGYQKCDHDERCPDYLACLRHKGCVNPCDVSNVCQPGRSCVPYRHRPACLKTANYEVEIPRDDLQIQTNDELDLTEIPVGVNSSCFIKSGVKIVSPCGSNSVCYDVDGKDYFCGCMVDFVGDPYVGCQPVKKCKNESACSSNEKCEGGFCQEQPEERNLCIPSKCENTTETCVIFRTTPLTAVCLPAGENFTKLNDSSETTSSSSQLFRSGACDLAGNCEEEGENQDEEEKDSTTTELAYITTSNDLLSSLSASIEEFSTPTHLIDTFNYSNETTPVSNDEYSVVDA